MSTRLAALAGIFAFAGAAFAHGEAEHARSPHQANSTEEKVFSREGDPKAATRTVLVRMSDRMRFTPSALDVKQNETIRFVVRNSGKLRHEMVLGTLDELKAHAELMKKHSGMEHEEPYMAHVAPGKTETMIWQFTRAGKFYFGCLEPGHFEAGMLGRITVIRR